MSVNPTTLKRINELILVKYQSMENPDHSFVEKSLADKPYDSVVKMLLKCGFRLEEDTDPNEDVSFGYVISGENDTLFLQLSMIGPYALLQRVLLGRLNQLIVCNSPPKSVFIQKVLEILEKMKITVLNEEILTYPVSLPLFNTKVSDVKIYQALFTDSELIPWE